MSNIINKIHRFESQRIMAKLDRTMLVVLYWSGPDRVLTVDAYQQMLRRMGEEDLATHVVFQIDPIMVDWLPDSLEHIWTLEDVIESQCSGS